MTDTIKALRDALPALKGWPLYRVEQREKGSGLAEIGSSYDDQSFAPVVTVDTGLYYQDSLAVPLARAISAACTSAPALLAEVDRQAAEIARLRAALEQIARMPHAPDAWIVAGIALQSPGAARAALERQ